MRSSILLLLLSQSTFCRKVFSVLPQVVQKMAEISLVEMTVSSDIIFFGK